MISFLSQTWLPVVSTCAPRSKSSSAMRRREAESAGGVFGVDDDEIDGAALDDVAEVLVHDAAAGAAEDVADEEDAHGIQGTGCSQQGTGHRSAGRYSFVQTGHGDCYRFSYDGKKKLW